MGLLLERAMSLFAAAQERTPKATGTEQLWMVAAGLRQHIATREPFATEAEFDIQVATLWGAKGVTADHVYILGACDEAIPGERRDEYPGTDSDFVEEQRRLFYVSITRAKRTLVLSRATEVSRGEALRLGLAADPRPFRIDLEMTRFLRDILPLLPKSLAGERWDGCVVPKS
jgi:ATP-dependent exoDNAse (exonuclease V) beta subunit